MKRIPKKLKPKPKFCSGVVCRELCSGPNKARLSNVIWQKSPSAEVWAGPALFDGQAVAKELLHLRVVLLASPRLMV